MLDFEGTSEIRRGLRFRGGSLSLPGFLHRDAIVVSGLLLAWACARPLAGRLDAAVLRVPEELPAIQVAIDAASNGDEILVAPGTYQETLSFAGKAVALRSIAGPEVTIIDADGLAGSVVTCDHGEGPDTLIDGFTITGGTGTPFLGLSVGGGVFTLVSDPTVIRCIITGNAADTGGGLGNVGGSPTLIGCRFTANTASMGAGGGGISSQGGRPVVDACAFHDNIAETFGGGMSNVGSHPTLTNCLFVGNVAALGGGVRNTGSNPVLINCTIAANEASYGGGIRNSSASRPVVRNGIIWGNAPDAILDLAGSETSVEWSDVAGGWPGLGNVDLDPRFVAAAEENYRPAGDSPCIDAGDNGAVPDGIVTDIDGNARIQGGVVDMGVYEPPASNRSPCTADLSGDGVVGLLDLLAVLSTWGPCPVEGACPADLSGDGVVGFLDLLELLAQWGATCR